MEITPGLQGAELGAHPRPVAMPCTPPAGSLPTRKAKGPAVSPLPLTPRFPRSLVLSPSWTLSLRMSLPQLTNTSAGVRAQIHVYGLDRYTSSVLARYTHVKYAFT